MGNVFGGDDGLVSGNSLFKKTESLVTVDKLRDVYLFGLNIADGNGNPLPDAVYQQYIDNAVSLLEHFLDISITPVEQFVEYKDYHMPEYWDWGYFQLNNFPVICIRELSLVYFRDANADPIEVQTIPNNWIRLQAHDGIIRLIPNASFPAKLQISGAGTFFPELLKARMVPHAWKFTYDYGFPTGKIPVLLNQAISTIAALQALIVGGNLVLGAGIAGSSISLDGLSQSIQTTQSAENSAYSATIKDYGQRLFGSRQDDPFAIMTILKDYYKGANINII